MVEVAVFDAGDDLVEEPAGFVGIEPPLGDNVIEKLPIGDVLHHHKDVGRGVDDFVEADDVWVGAHFEDVDLAADFFAHVQLFDAVAVEDFDGDLCVCVCVLVE